LYARIHDEETAAEAQVSNIRRRLKLEERSMIIVAKQISTGFASWLRYYSDVTQGKPTKLCTMFGRLLRGYTIYTFLVAVAP